MKEIGFIFYLFAAWGRRKNSTKFWNPASNQPIQQLIFSFSATAFQLNLNSIKLWFEWKKIKLRRKGKELLVGIGWIKLINYFLSWRFAFFSLNARETELIPKFSFLKPPTQFTLFIKLNKSDAKERMKDLFAWRNWNLGIDFSWIKAFEWKNELQANPAELEWERINYWFSLPVIQIRL